MIAISFILDKTAGFFIQHLIELVTGNTQSLYRHICKAHTLILQTVMQHNQLNISPS